MAERSRLAGAAQAAVARRRGAAEGLGADADAVARACHAMAVRFHRGGTLLTFGTGGAAADAAHVAVEFVHPVIVGKRALPAVYVCGDVATVSGAASRDGVAEMLATPLTLLGRPADIAMGLSADGAGPALARAFEVAHQQGLLTVAIAGDSGGPLAGDPNVDHLLAVGSADPRVVKEVTVTAYHVLWELVHVFLEAPGALDRAGAA